jgi:ankyrin repeat protein
MYVPGFFKRRDFDLWELNSVQEGHTPLHSASVYGHMNVVERLLAAGAEVNSKDNVSPSFP